jgi:hypothetical protein
MGKWENGNVERRTSNVESWEWLISWDGGVHFQGPTFDAAGHAPDVLIAFLAEEEGGFSAAHAVVAMDDDGLSRIREDAGVAFGEFAEGEEFGAFDAAGVPFLGLAAVDEAEGRAGFLQVGDGFGFDLDFVRGGEGAHVRAENALLDGDGSAQLDIVEEDL